MGRGTEEGVRREGPAMAEGTDNLPDPLDAVVEDFLSRHRQGARPSPDEYAARPPELAERIHALFPTLLLLEPAPAPAAPPARLGEYVLLREAGRGGMG